MEHPRQVFRDRLPWHGFATDDLRSGLRLLGVAEAIRKAIVQYNARHSVGWLCYDIDRDGAAFDWYERNGPAPNIVAINRDNGHAHYLYGLEKPVHDYADARPAPLRYMAAVDVGLTELLGADFGYSKLLCKNALHDRWVTLFPRHALYILDELADYVELKRYLDRRRKLPAYGLGRNCMLFEGLRRWAYRARRQPWLSEEMFRLAVLGQALAINAGFAPPLPHNEVRHTVKSVSRWTWRRMSADGFREYQRTVGARGNATEKAKARELRERILETHRDCPGLTQEDIAAIHGVTRETVNRHLRASVTSPISDRETDGPGI